MSSNENPDAFDTFMNDFAEAAPEPEAAAVVEESAEIGEDLEEEVEDPAATTDEAEPEEAEEPEEAADEGEVEEAPKKGKKSAQERISEVVAKQREAERKLEAERAANADLMERLRRLEETQKPAKEDPAPAKDYVPAGAEFGLTEPTADDVTESGEPKYALGEFDPKYLRDLSRYDRAVEKAYEAQVAERKTQEAAVNAEAQQLVTEWNAKLVAAEKTSPKLREKAANLVDTFADVDAVHGQTLAQAIMSLDNGTSVLEYLADNLDEADRIIKLPTAKAMIQLGKLDALYEQEEVAQKPQARTTKAPTPPTALSRGTGTPKQGGIASMYDKMLQDFR